MRHLNVYCQIGDNVNTNWYFGKILNDLITSFPDVQFNHITEQRTSLDFSHNFCKGGYDLFVVENPKNNKYTLINFTDLPYQNFYKNLYWDVTKIQQWYCTNGVTRENYKKWKNDQNQHGFHSSAFFPDDFLDSKWVPISYHPIGEYTENIIEQNYITRKNIQKLDDKLIFRGNIGPQDRYELLVNKNKWLNENFEIYQPRINADDYFKEQLNLLFGWSIHGIGDASYRDIEIFGSGQCMFRTSFSSTFNDQPIPGVHYVKICDTQVNAGLTTTNYQEYSKNIIELQQSIKYRYDEFKQIGENGRQWYLKNGRRDSPNNTYQIFKRTFNIDLLFN